MRYLLHRSQILEISGRKQYLYDIFHLFFVPGSTIDSYIPLIPVGKIDSDILFITGHDNDVMHFLKKHINTIPEKTIVVTMCSSYLLVRFIDKKQIYVPKDYCEYCYTYDGRPYGFTFDVSTPELDFYNSSCDNLMSKIQSAYRQL